jgi:tetratricopeptide (TPR) repeat protein
MIDAALLQPLVDRLSCLFKQAPHPTLPRRLTALFRMLQGEDEDHFETEDLIWAIWCDHPTTDYADRMEAATQAMAQKDFGACHALLARLQVDVPDWAEVWNKSATLYFLMGEDDKALIDIGRTLDLEPRHFGALAGFGEICLRHNEPDVAQLAFRAALAINPHLHGIAAQMSGVKKSSLH